MAVALKKPSANRQKHDAAPTHKHSKGLNSFNYMTHWWAYLVINTEKMHSVSLIICIHKVNYHVVFSSVCWDEPGMLIVPAAD